MAKKTLNIGTTANDGQGDTLRDAAGKINDNFTELFAAAFDSAGGGSGYLTPENINTLSELNAILATGGSDVLVDSAEIQTRIDAVAGGTSFTDLAGLNSNLSDAKLVDSAEIQTRVDDATAGLTSFDSTNISTLADLNTVANTTLVDSATIQARIDASGGAAGFTDLAGLNSILSPDSLIDSSDNRLKNYSYIDTQRKDSGPIFIAAMTQSLGTPYLWEVSDADPVERGIANHTIRERPAFYAGIKEFGTDGLGPARNKGRYSWKDLDIDKDPVTDTGDSAAAVAGNTDVPTTYPYMGFKGGGSTQQLHGFAVAIHEQTGRDVYIYKVDWSAHHMQPYFWPFADSDTLHPNVNTSSWTVKSYNEVGLGWEEFNLHFDSAVAAGQLLDANFPDTPDFFLFQSGETGVSLYDDFAEFAAYYKNLDRELERSGRLLAQTPRIFIEGGHTHPTFTPYSNYRSAAELISRPSTVIPTDWAAWDEAHPTGAGSFYQGYDNANRLVNFQAEASQNTGNRLLRRYLQPELWADFTVGNGSSPQLNLLVQQNTAATKLRVPFTVLSAEAGGHNTRSFCEQVGEHFGSRNLIRLYQDSDIWRTYSISGDGVWDSATNTNLAGSSARATQRNHIIFDVELSNAVGLQSGTFDESFTGKVRIEYRKQSLLDLLSTTQASSPLNIWPYTDDSATSGGKIYHTENQLIGEKVSLYRESGVEQSGDFILKNRPVGAGDSTDLLRRGTIGYPSYLPSIDIQRGIGDTGFDDATDTVSSFQISNESTEVSNTEGYGGASTVENFSVKVINKQGFDHKEGKYQDHSAVEGTQIKQNVIITYENVGNAGGLSNTVKAHWYLSPPHRLKLKPGTFTTFYNTFDNKDWNFDIISNLSGYCGEKVTDMAATPTDLEMAKRFCSTKRYSGVFGGLTFVENADADGTDASVQGAGIALSRMLCSNEYGVMDYGSSTTLDNYWEQNGSTFPRCWKEQGSSMTIAGSLEYDDTERWALGLFGPQFGFTTPQAPAGNTDRWFWTWDLDVTFTRNV